MSQVVDTDPLNERATVLADLSEPDSLPAGRFNCFILTQALRYIPDLDVTIRNAWRALMPGGTLLISVLTLSGVDPVRREADLRRLTPLGLERVVARTCQGAEIETRGYGNGLVGTPIVMGLSTQDQTESETRSDDAGFSVVVCARIRKSVG